MLNELRSFAATLPTLNGFKPWQAYNWGADTYLIQVSNRIRFTVKHTAAGWQVQQDWWLPQGGRVHTTGFKKVSDYQAMCDSVQNDIERCSFLFDRWQS